MIDANSDSASHRSRRTLYLAGCPKPQLITKLDSPVHLLLAHRRRAFRLSIDKEAESFNRIINTYIYIEKISLTEIDTAEFVCVYYCAFFWTLSNTLYY